MAKTLEQILHDPENQPSQYGTVPYEWYEYLEIKLAQIRSIVDGLGGSYEVHAIRKKLQEVLNEGSKNY